MLKMKGSIRKRGATWSYSFELAQIAGKRKRVEKGGFRTKALAESALAKAIAEYNSCGNSFKPSEISVTDYCDYWLENYAKANYRPTTYAMSKSYINYHIKNNIGGYKLRALTPAILQEWVNNIKSHSSMVNIATKFSKMLRYAVHPLGFIQQNPMQYVELPKSQKQTAPIKVITDKDFLKIMELFPQGNKYHLAFCLGLYCGLRIDEAMSLTWTDILPIKDEINVHQQLYKYEGAWHMGRVKTAGSVRFIKYGKLLADELRFQRTWQEKNKKLYGEYYLNHYLHDGIICTLPASIKAPDDFIPLDFINTWENGQIVNYVTMNSPVNRIKKVLGKNFNYHMLRHTHATKLINGGAKLKTVQTRLGHSRAQTTIDVYVHDTEEMENEAVAIIESCLPKIKASANRRQNG